MSLENCCNPCQTTQTVNVPGVSGEDGADGADGADGLNAYTTTIDDTVIVDHPNNTTIAVTNCNWMAIGQVIVLDGPAHFEVISKPGTTSVVALYLEYDGDLAAGVTIASGATVSPSGLEPDMTGYAASGANADITSLSALSTPLSIVQGGTGGGSVSAATKSLGTRYRLLGYKTGWDMNVGGAGVTGDNEITGFPSSYVIDKILVTNASISMTTAQGGVYTQSGKGGIAIVAAGQAYAALTTAVKVLELTLANTERRVNTSCWLSLTTPQGAAATADAYIFGWDLS